MNRPDTRVFHAHDLPIDSRNARGSWGRDNLAVYSRSNTKGQRCYIHFNGGVFQVDKPTAAALIVALAEWIDTEGGDLSDDFVLIYDDEEEDH